MLQTVTAGNREEAYWSEDVRFARRSVFAFATPMLGIAIENVPRSLFLAKPRVK